jgi:hypothetical protein
MVPRFQYADLFGGDAFIVGITSGSVLIAILIWLVHVVR